ncbi:hypothetical protein DRV85_11255 [Rhodosalinus halophilus]|uniref:Uncharacterized protein n=1 Tax=Rhodosalinus halophilus TaxID=2259333 RepID=A0A365U8S6_9RHOB|nr:hypothetical protein [Rhodosalinus halophilus]RBI84531.1 hypothetical protein DRV85_11255 [Rhodosalinus halophilus]
MSPPDTNLEREKRRHRPALIGIGAVLVFALIVVFALAVTVTDGERPEQPQAAPDATDTAPAE